MFAISKSVQIRDQLWPVIGRISTHVTESSTDTRTHRECFGITTEVDVETPGDAFTWEETANTDEEGVLVHHGEQRQLVWDKRPTLNWFAKQNTR